MDNNKALVPGAIIIAGLFIAGAVYYNGRGPAPAAPEEQNIMEFLTNVAEDISVDVDAFTACLDDDRHVQTVQEDLQDAQQAGGTGTPYSVIVTNDGRTISVNGAQPFQNVQPVFDVLIAGGDITPTLVPNQIVLEDITLAEVTEEDHIRGSFDAPFILVEYSDIDCPYCARFHETMTQVMNTYGDSGQVAWVYRHFPLTQLHPNAGLKAEASECFAELGGNDTFWNYLDIDFAS